MSKNVEKQKLNEERILSTRPLLADVANCRRRHGYNEKMTAGLRPLQPPPPEWLHTGPYFLLALALHLAVVFYPLPLSVDKLEVTPPLPVTVTLQEELAPPQVIPPAPPEKVQKPIKQHREKPAPAPRPVIAVTPAKVSAPTTFTVPAPVVTPPPLAPPAPASNSAPPAPPSTTVSAVRFDAAYLQNPHPAYPALSRRLGEEGKVLLKVRVTAEGRAAAVDIEKTSNFERLDESARQSVARWRFVPARRGDEAIEATVIVPIVFRLEN